MKNKALHKTAPDTHILTIVGLMVLALILMAILQPGNYFTLKNAKSMIFQFPEYGILAFGMMVCMIAGGIDLSLVGIMNFTGVLAAMIVTKMTEGGEGMAISAILVAIVTALVVGGACGAFNGFIIGYFNIPAMLVTLCGLQLYTGLAYGITGGPAINGMCDAFKNIANGTVAGIPYVLFIYIIVVAVVAFVMRSTVFGNEIYFLGSNAKASRYSGINTLRVTIMTHMFSGILGGVSGILITSHLNSAKSSNGSTYTLLTLLIVVLGGIHPDGGKGRVTGVALATILLQMIANAFGLLHMDDNAKTFVNGCLLVAALLLDVYLDKRAAKKKAA
ncbi:ABC transporter permease [Hominiventricola filiformis]|uniref:ABC transporter permease n=1 Tax=Hominiventricola filiformis TaxID=2885352 RepID=A0AAE3DAQ9_9FIRM|nr:ABC transporter permease [Hominiventricola filiformis]MCC2124609.1 ABC transporter permease [Hominiventricola filiformis]RHU85899.1 ABC transporter permease [Clostridiaceae bacterium OM08-6BH]